MSVLIIILQKVSLSARLQMNKTLMKHLLDEFTSLVEQYERGLDPCHDEAAIRAVDDMADWVNDNLDALDCDSIEDIFDE